MQDRSEIRMLLDAAERQSPIRDFRRGKRHQISRQCDRCERWFFWDELRGVDLVNRHGAQASFIVCPRCLAELHREQTVAAAMRWNLSEDIAAALARKFRRSLDTSEQSFEHRRFKPHYLGLDDVFRLWTQQKGICSLSGFGMNPLSESSWDRPSLDRIDSRKGYIPGNVQWVCWAVNLMKQTLEQEAFVRWCCRVAEHSGKALRDGKGSAANDSETERAA